MSQDPGKELAVTLRHLRANFTKPVTTELILDKAAINLIVESFDKSIQLAERQYRELENNRILLARTLCQHEGSGVMQ